MIFVKLTKTFTVSGCETVEQLDAHTDEVMERLLALESDTVRDADVTAALAQGKVSVSVAAGGSDFDEAIACADSCIRAAIHAAGGHTPEWVTIKTNSEALVDA